ncbi:MAG TPA: alkaline phosphatase family protein [Anaerolineae bacterium]|nr:alkaline phosphatase family protein [Anaerolineae bacterium]
MIVLGIDGASPKTVFDWAEKGILPEFAKLLKQSSFGTLWSISTSSAACWTSHLTGVRPARSGVEGFLKGNRFARTDDIQLKTYPELLSERGHRVGLVNMPITHPPLTLEDGFCVGGQLTPVGSDDYTRPLNLGRELDDYDIGIQYGIRRYGFVDDELEIPLAQLKEDVLRVATRRINNARMLMRRLRWDLFALLITGTDSLQHFFWHQLDTRQAERTAIFELYRRIDAFVGRLRKDYPKEHLLILSDHGFQRDYWESSPSHGRIIHRVQARLGRTVPDRIKQSRLYSYSFDLFTRSAALFARPRTVGRPGTTLVHTGNHDRKGVWILAGPGIKRDNHLDIGFLDLNPVIMYLMDSPIPTCYDGRFVAGIFDHDPRPLYSDSPLAVDRVPAQDEDELAVRERLEGLGYIEMVERDK